MSFNLVRNSRVFFTTNIDGANNNAVLTTGLTAANTFEIQVQDGFTFSQATESDTITLNEAGLAPARGQRSFNKALNPVEFSFSTYQRPRLATTLVVAEEKHLWNALLGDTSIPTTQASSVGTSIGATRASTTATVGTITGTGITNLPITGRIYTIKGLTGAPAQEWNVPVQIIGTPTATNIQFNFLTAPNVGAGTTCAGAANISFVEAAWSEHLATGGTSAYSLVTSANSNKNTLVPFGLIFLVDSVAYAVDNCAMDQAVIDFGLDAIASIAWSGKGTKLRQLAAVTFNTGTSAFSGGLTGTATPKETTAKYITNKLASVSLQSNLGGVSGTSYVVALTGGSITIANNINYLTPANLGSVNLPIGYFTGTRAVSGNLTAYLRGTSYANGTGQLLSDILANSTTNTETKFRLQVEIGGSTAATRVEVEVDGAQLSVPSVEVQQVVSATINFTAQGVSADLSGGTGTYDITQPNELNVRYWAN